MLDLLRKKKESMVIKVVFVIIVLSFIGTIFLVWGKGEEGIGRSKGYAAKVDRTVISLTAYQQAYQNMVATYRQVFGNAFTSETEKQLNLRQQVIDRLIDNVLLLKGAKKEGISVSKEEISQAISSMPVFQANGSFDYALYQQLLRSNRITAQEFEESKQRELLLVKTRKAIMAKGAVSDAEVATQYHKERDVLQVQLIGFAPAELLKQVTVTDAELQDYLNKHQDRFKTPERISVSYSLIPRAGIVASPVTAEEIEAFYRKNMDRYLDAAKSPLPFPQVKERVRKDAQQAKQSKAAYEKVADTLFKNIKSGDLKTVATAFGATVQETPLFSAAAVPAAVSSGTTDNKRLFDLKQGEIGGPFETSRGILIVKIREKQAGAVPKLAEVRNRLEQQLKPEKAAELAKQKAVATQKGLATAAAATPKATSLHYSSKGEIPTVGTSPVLMERLFALTSQQPALSEPILVGSRWYAARLIQRQAAPEAGLATAREDIRKRLTPIKQEETFKTWLANLRKNATIVINPALTATTP